MVTLSKLSSMEQAFWYQYKLNPKDASNNIIHRVDFQCKITLESLEQALQKVSKKHPALRSQFLEEDGIPYRAVLPNGNFLVELYKLNTIKDAAVLSQMQAPFDLQVGKLVRCVLIDREVGVSLYVSLPHIIFDDVSWRIFLEDLTNFIMQESSNVAEIGLNYPLEDLSSLNFWLNELANVSEKVNLECDSSTYSKTDDNLGISSLEITSDLVDSLIYFSRSLKISMNVFYISLFSVLLYKMTSNTDMIIATPITVRDEKSKSSIGLYINVMPCRFKIESKCTIKDFLRNKGKDFWQYIDNRNFSLTKLVSCINHHREQDDPGLYSIMLEYVRKKTFTFPNINNECLVPNRQAKMDIVVSIIESSKGQSIYIEYDKTKYTEEYIKELCVRFTRLCSNAAKNPLMSIADICLLTDKERSNILAIGCIKEQSIGNSFVWDRFESVVKTCPSAIAIRHNSRAFSYSAIYSLAEKYASLLNKQGIGRASIVGIYMDRSPEYIACMLAIWSLGAIYLPLDTKHPPERIRIMIEQAGNDIVITSTKFQSNLPISLCSCVIDDNSIRNKRFTPLFHFTPQGNDIAYIIFTSGSTGVPKGVMITHQGFLNHLEIMIQELTLKQGIVVAQTASVAFDISVWQMICPLVCGGTVAICDDDILLDVERLYTFLKEYDVFVLEVVPSLLSTYLDAERTNQSLQGGLSKLQIITTGEAISGTIAQKWTKQYPKRTLLNAYGPAEASDDTHFYKISSQNLDTTKPIPIGYPLLNIKTYIVDKDTQLCPIGVVGEICIGGISVAAGYINNQQLTQQSFVDDPFSQIGTMYKTGDYGKWLKDGTLEYRGRQDNQVKIRGQRVELGEIESQLMSDPRVKDAAVIVLNHEVSNRLLAFVVTIDKIISPSDIKLSLKNRLPSFMVPWNVILLDEIPRNISGKVDRNALFDINKRVNCRLPKEETENGLVVQIINIWSRTLNKEIKKDTNYFEAGGDSLLSLHIVSLLNGSGVNVSVRDILMYQTPEELAACCESKISNNNSNSEYENTEGRLFEYTPIQQEYLEISGTQYKNTGQIQVLLLSEGADLDIQILEEMFEKIVNAHKSLQPKLKVKKAPIFEDGVERVDLDSINLLIEDLRTRISIDSRPLIVKKIYLDGVMKLLIIAHHFAVDLYSWDVIIDQLTHLIEKREIPFEIDNASKVWWDSKLNMLSLDPSLLKEIKYWQNQLSLPIQTQFRKLIVTESYRLYLEIPKSIEQLLSSQQVSLESLVYYSIICACCEIAKTTEFAYNIESSLRSIDTRGQLRRKVGWMTYVYPQRTKITTPPSISSFKRFHDQRKKVPNNGCSYGLLRYFLAPSSLELFEPPLWTLNYVGKAAAPNEKRQIIKALPYKTRPFVEVDVSYEEDKVVFDYLYNTLFDNISIKNIAEVTRKVALQILNECQMQRPLNVDLISKNRAQNMLKRIKDGNKINIEKVYPLLPSQRGVLVDSNGGSNEFYQQQICVKISSFMNKDLLEERISEVVKSYDILRSIFDWSEDEPLQVVISGLRAEIAILSHNEKASLDEFLKHEILQLSSLDTRPPIRFGILTIQEYTYLILTYHHILLDGPSIKLLLDFLINGRIIQKESKNCIEKYLNWLSDNTGESDINIWRSRLNLLTKESGILLSCVHSSKKNDRKSACLSDAFTQYLLDKSKKLHVTPAVYMQAVWTNWAIKYFKSDSIFYGLVMSTRIPEITDKDIGPYITTIPWTEQIGNWNTLDEMAAAIQNSILEIENAKHLGLGEIVRHVSPFASSFNIILTISTMPIQSNASYEILSSYENTSYPFAADIELSEKTKIIFASNIFNKEEFNLDDAFISFTRFCDGLLSNDLSDIRSSYRNSIGESHEIMNLVNANENIHRVLESVGKSLGKVVTKDELDNSFLELGGDSISAMRLKNLLSYEGVIVSVGDILRAKSLKHISTTADTTSGKREKLHLESYSDRETAQILYMNNKEDILPLSRAQELIVDDYIEGYGQDYHEQTAFHLVGEIDTAKINEAFQLLTLDYPTLRLIYPKDLPGKQVLLSSSQVEVEILHRDSNLSFDYFLSNIIQKDWREKFDIETGPLMRAAIQQKNDQEWYLFMGFSGLVTDGWSFSILLERLFVIYSELIKNDKYVQQPDYSYLNYCRRNPEKCSKNNRKAADKDYSSTILSKIYTIDGDLTSDLQRAAVATNITMSEMMLRIVSGATSQGEISRIFVSTHGREGVYDVMQSVGPYSKLVAYETGINKNVPIPIIYTEESPAVYYVYENYPKDSENRLKVGEVPSFKEQGQWRRDLLRPHTEIGFVIEPTNDGCMTVQILCRAGLKEAENIDTLHDKFMETIMKAIKKGA